MMAILPEDPHDLIELFSKILIKHEILDEIKNILRKSYQESGNGDGLEHGGKEFVTIEFKEEGKIPLELFLKKRPPTSADAILFDKEVFFYAVFLPDALAFVEQKDEFKEIPLAEMFPKCYHADTDIILLANVLKNGFVMTPVNRPHTFYQAEQVFEKLGMFHAVTYVMIKDLGVDEFRKKYSPLAEESVFLPEKANVHMKHWETTLEMSLAVLNETKTQVDGLGHAVSFLEKYKGKIFGELCDQVKSRNEDLLTTLNFGNVWNGNIFVLKDEEKKSYPGAMLIDPTMARIGSPLLDVSCYMFSCVAEHVRLTNYKYLLDVFYEFIRDKSEELGEEFETFVLQFDDLKVLYIGKSLYGIFCAINFLLEKCYRKPQGIAEDDFDTEKFVNWLQENPELNDAMAIEISSKINQYERYLQELTELE